MKADRLVTTTIPTVSHTRTTEFFNTFTSLFPTSKRPAIIYPTGEYILHNDDVMNY